MSLKLETALALEMYMTLDSSCVASAEIEAKRWLQQEAAGLARFEPGVKEALERILAKSAAPSIVPVNKSAPSYFNRRPKP